MIRGEDVICGTSTTGTGTLTLALCPIPPGGVDPFQAFGGLGLGTSQSTPMPYVIREFTDATFSTVKQEEKGIGSLLLGASVTATTLARTTPQSTATGCNTSTPTYSQGAPSAINVGVAQNVLVFVGAGAADIPAYSPYFETSGDNLGVTPLCVMAQAQAIGANLTSALDLYILFEWRVPMLVKKASVRVQTAYSGGSPVSNAYAAIYAIGSNGRPGKLLIDFGLLGTANVSLNTGTANISSAVAGTGFMLLGGEYFFRFLPIFSGGVTLPQMALAQYVTCGRLGTFNGGPQSAGSATGGSAGAAPDPANVASYAPLGPGTRQPTIILAPS